MTGRTAGMALRAGTVAVLVAGAATVLAAPAAAAAPATLYAYATGTGTTSGCPASTVTTSQCSLATALARAAAGETVALATPGSTAPYVGNWEPATPGTSASLPLTLTAAPGVQNPVLDGNLGSATGCGTASCSASILTVDSGVFLHLTGVTFSHGRAGFGAAINNGDGGAGGTIAVANSTFTDNVARAEGGAIDNADGVGATGTVTVSNSTFYNNGAGQSGGAINNGLATGGAGAMTVVSSTFTQNSAGQDGGGAIANATYGGTAALTVTASMFSYNSTTGDGGAIVNGAGTGPSSGSSGALVVGTTKFVGNSADSGGAIANADTVPNGSSSAAVSQSTFLNDTAKNFGGALLTARGGPGTATVDSSTFYNNSAAHGGGAINAFRSSGSGSATVRESTFNKNSASDGGAIRTSDSGGGTTTVVGSTLAGDSATASASAEIWAGSGSVVVSGNLLAGTCLATAGTWYDDGYNAASDGTCERSGASGDVANASVATTLGRLAYNGYTTSTMAPDSSSPAVGLVPNGATAAHAPAAVGQLCARTDQAGLPTPSGGTCNAGAVDLQAPGGVTATPGNGQVTLSWHGASPKGRAVAGFAAFYSTAPSGQNLQTPNGCTSTGTSCTVTGLQNGTTYWFVVGAENTRLAASAEVSATPARVPDAPTAVTAVGLPNQARVSWQAPANNGGSPITGYRVYVASASGQEVLDSNDSCETNATTLSCTVNRDMTGAGLVGGRTYWFSVEALNATGASTLATPDAAAVIYNHPGPPTGVRAVIGDGRVAVSWTPPAGDGSSPPIVAYEVFASAKPHDVTAAPACSTSGTGRSCTATGLRNGVKYYLDVFADADGGASPPVEVAAVPAPVPTLALNHAVVAKRARAVLSGRVAPGASVALYAAGHKLATVKASSTGAYSFTRTLSATTSFTVTSLGRTSHAVKVTVVPLTLAVVGRQPLRAGSHVLTGHAPRGMTVVLAQDGRTIAHTTATSKNTFTFRLRLTKTHGFRISCDGVTTTTIKVRVR